MLEGKELCIAVAEKNEDRAALVFLNRDRKPAPECVDGYIRDYLIIAAAETLAIEGMAEKIGKRVFYKGKFSHHVEGVKVERNWWRSITPEKILNVYLEIEL